MPAAEPQTLQTPRPARLLRGLIVDEAIIPGGVETIRRNLIPALNRRCASLAWALANDGDRFHDMQSTAPGLRIEPMIWPQGTPGRWAHAITRRTRGLSAGRMLYQRIDTHLNNARIESLARDSGAEFLLTTCIFSQPVPRTNLPLFGIICDVNPNLPKEIRANMARWIQHCTGVFAISDFTRSRLADSWPEFAGKISVLPLAPELPRSNAVPSSRTRLIYPAAANSYKNHLALFQAAKHLRADQYNFQLVLTGPGTDRFSGDIPFHDAELDAAREYFRRESLGDVITCKGLLAAPEYEELLQSASACVLPSRYEGFGLPLIESIARGLPVICSNIEPFLEQLSFFKVSDCAIVFSLEQPDAFRSALKNLLDGRGPEPIAPSEIQARMQSWTWEDVAERCLGSIAESL